MGEVSVFIAFTAGILSFLSPCVLPIVPGYLSYISGVAGAQEQPKGFNFKVFLASILFVLGFSLVFTLLGASATTVGQFLRSYQDLIAKVGGGVVVFFGLHFAGAFLRPNFLREILGFSAFLVALFLFSAISQKLLFDLLGIVLIVLFLYAFGVHEKLYAQKRLEVKLEGFPSLVPFWWALSLPLVGLLALDQFLEAFYFMHPNRRLLCRVPYSCLPTPWAWVFPLWWLEAYFPCFWDL
jgi:cytochrome c biogenesis protein CcdA